MWILIESEIWIGVKADILSPFTLFARKSIKQSIFQQRFSLFFPIFLLFFFLLAYKISFTSCNPIDWWNIKWAPLFGSLHCYLSSTQVPPCKRVCVCVEVCAHVLTPPVGICAQLRAHKLTSFSLFDSLLGRTSEYILWIWVFDCDSVSCECMLRRVAVNAELWIYEYTHIM